jgi:hypothetical protein
MSRLHQKFHRNNHHSLKNVNIQDAGWDPIASAESPFLGNFYLSGSMFATSGVYASSLTVNGNIDFNTPIVVDTKNFVGNYLTLTVNGSAVYLPLYH